MKNDRALADMLAELDAELAARADAWPAAREILTRVEGRSPGSVQRLAAEQQLRALNCRAAQYVL
ncbi:hypothetical protein [Brevundimonas goettingensis]|jgi:hypothetical protein|uniref:Uncharacterized protein n=1 Tax=Brevundimonas goettingensis TaxID=2774190 RepID=A0A975C125_9CAUL|nr:hypothetical protein [Brevundimonas goettingensis]QTC90469.1 hypothetical protein IFJ75_14460 [Brevundimonas goettingensis]